MPAPGLGGGARFFLNLWTDLQEVSAEGRSIEIQETARVVCGQVPRVDRHVQRYQSVTIGHARRKIRPELIRHLGIFPL